MTNTDIVTTILSSVFDGKISSGIGGRLKRELTDLTKLGLCDAYSLSFTCEIDNTRNEHFYRLKFFNLIDYRWYEFRLSAHYPFYEPKLLLNDIPYETYLQMNSCAFKRALYKYTGNNCFCCKSILSKGNWIPMMLLKDVVKEIDDFHQLCRKVSTHVIVNVIKRKYLIDDINLMEWVY